MAAAAWQGMLKEVIAPLPQSDLVQDKKNSLSARESVQCVTFMSCWKWHFNSILTCISERGYRKLMIRLFQLKKIAISPKRGCFKLWIIVVNSFNILLIMHFFSTQMFFQAICFDSFVMQGWMKWNMNYKIVFNLYKWAGLLFHSIL